MLLAKFALFVAVATLAVADDTTLAATSTPSSPSTPPPLAGLSTDVLSSDATAPSCTCHFNDERKLTELVCAGSEEQQDENEVMLDTILRVNCTYVLVEVVYHNLVVINNETFAAKPQLQYVHLHSNHIEQIDREAFRVLSLLVDVDLSGNSLTNVDSRLFADNPLLTSVSLAGNPLIDLTANAPILESDSITSLDLSMCKLTSLSVESFSKLPSLRRLDLSSNKIQQISVTALQSPPQLNALIIGNNRWNCDCAFKEVADFARTMEETDSRVRCFGANRTLESWSMKTAEKYCPDLEYEHVSSEEYDDDEDEDLADTNPAIEGADEEETDLVEVSTDLLKDTDDLRQEMNELLAAEDTEVDETPDADEAVDGVIVEDAEVEETPNTGDVLVVFEGDDGDAEVAIIPITLLVFLLTALIVFSVGVAIVVCRILIRWYCERPGWRRLNEDVEVEGEGFTKVPLE